MEEIAAVPRHRLAEFNNGLDPDIVTATIRIPAINALLVPADAS
ncbi:hypothetical protein [Streptomyces iranensis]|uniref:Uncharacterized protein n=1 Tax=Streptomyces iranensis TaxID=576784 RepID=A0A061A5J1_9ACTN|nr:hypothetical protein [Streptomyces iranensis]MBP2067564.1 hypothetical protein [Streptomyces iranensis]CDR17609.1 predicted protein [Streptomyces iranensis]